ncbi:uncharacterized protein BXZ73DRAFT_101633 [Epithele typhae]|uniref:uncharacterized protein n=1 Tax=Epithele typhae TaxID=378194 RepID=UPI00200775EF|nr:uncharacterized protein BXZ73DRAFT_101633 [Epithele typhae]KAH9931728.1 hypothetical protein BXZ73DRAFT_101633 [Epithele typhae]
MLTYPSLHPLPPALAPPNPLRGAHGKEAQREPTPGLVNKKRVRYQGPAAQLREWFLRYTRDWILNDSQEACSSSPSPVPSRSLACSLGSQASVLRSVPAVRPRRKYGLRSPQGSHARAQKPDRAQAILCDAAEEETVDHMAVVDEDVTMSTATDLQLEDARDMLSSLTLTEADDVPMAYEEDPAAGVEPLKPAAAVRLLLLSLLPGVAHTPCYPSPCLSIRLALMSKLCLSLWPSRSSPAAITAAKPVIVPDEPKTAAATEEPKASVVDGPKATTPVVQKPKVVVVVLIVDKPKADAVEETKASTVSDEPQPAAMETPTVAATGDPVANEPSASTAHSFKPAAAIARSTSVLSDLTCDLYACGDWSGDNWDVLATSTPPRGACTPLHQLMASLTLCDAPESDTPSLTGAAADVFGPKPSPKTTRDAASSCSWEASMSFTQVISSLASSHRPATGSSAGASSSSSAPQVQEVEDKETKAEGDDDIWYETVEVMVGIVEEVEDEDEVWHDASDVFDDVVVEVL